MQVELKIIKTKVNKSIDFDEFLEMNVDELKDCNTDKMDDTYLTEAFKRRASTEEEVNDLLLIGDRNEEGHINYEELVKAMMSKPTNNNNSLKSNYCGG
ncbi:hypothetical protein KUTeg_014405 [Tegillarca granosa]|uniref:EF-hand domain-containing protein n=1 Tax=Tegillarca granosa TaxID=220873 RepID=A0ABQ9EWG5_TEGGR|nr:hypothetical protein KUTeg_014405 [Tegillarca granosa]